LQLTYLCGAAARFDAAIVGPARAQHGFRVPAAQRGPDQPPAALHQRERPDAQRVGALKTGGAPALCSK
jgi:hypothetical protein